MTQGAEFDQVANLDKVGIEFLAASGVEDLKALTQSHAELLHEEMVAANALLKIDSSVPSLSVVEGWISSARGLVDDYQEEAIVKLAVIDEAADEVAKVPSEVAVMEAIPVPPSLLVEQKIAVSDVPVMEQFVEVERVETRPPKAIDDDSARKSIEVREVAADDVISRITDRGEEGERNEVMPLEKNPVRDIRKAPSPELNEGKKPHSRSYIRGVLHPQPFRVRFAAFVTLMAMLLVPATFIAGGLMMAKIPNWIWYAGIPVGLLLFGILYFIYARGLRCRICGQPLFAAKRCHRHVKAHRIPVIGYILPTTVQILLFHWFRCMYCGTSIRLKE